MREPPPEPPPEPPTVSVLMPVHDAARFLREALDSLWAQTFSDFEVVAMDDGSTDGSRAMLEEESRREPRLRVLRLEHVGTTAALNAGLAEARGAWIARMDADDVSLPHRFETQLAWLAEHPGVVALGSATTLIDEDGDRIADNPYPLGHDAILARMLTGRAALAHPAVMMRADAVRGVGGYDTGYATAQDFDLWLRLSAEGELANLEAPLLRYRQHASSVGSRRRREQHAAVIQALQAHATRTNTLMPTVPHVGKAVSATQQQAAWARWALRGGEPATARKHAKAALRRRPWDARLWCILWRARGRFGGAGVPPAVRPRA